MFGKPNTSSAPAGKPPVVIRDQVDSTQKRIIELRESFKARHPKSQEVTDALNALQALEKRNAKFDSLLLCYQIVDKLIDSPKTMRCAAILLDDFYREKIQSMSQLRKPEESQMAASMRGEEAFRMFANRVKNAVEIPEAVALFAKAGEIYSPEKAQKFMASFVLNVLRLATPSSMKIAAKVAIDRLDKMDPEKNTFLTSIGEHSSFIDALAGRFTEVADRTGTRGSAEQIVTVFLEMTGVLEENASRLEAGADPVAAKRCREGISNLKIVLAKYGDDKSWYHLRYLRSFVLRMQDLHYEYGLDCSLGLLKELSELNVISPNDHYLYWQHADSYLTILTQNRKMRYTPGSLVTMYNDVSQHLAAEAVSLRERYGIVV